MSTTLDGLRFERSIDQLTRKELEVVDHLSRHKTSKEIATALGIRENTVDKHILSVREKWRTRDRKDTARAYLSLEGTQGGGKNLPPQFSPRDDCGAGPPDALSELPTSTVFRLSDVLAPEQFDLSDDVAPGGLEALDSRFGKAWRIGAILLITVLLVVVMLGGLAIAQAVTTLL